GRHRKAMGGYRGRCGCHVAGAPRALPYLDVAQHGLPPRASRGPLRSPGRRRPRRAGRGSRMAPDQTGNDRLMLKAYFHRMVPRLERSFGYDAGYMHEVIETSPKAFFKFSLFQIMSSHRDAAPRDAWFAARIAAAMSEDCGPCTQLVV